MRKRKRIVFALALIGGLVVFFLFTRPSAQLPRILPNPNGYDVLLKTARQLPADMPELAALAEGELRGFLRANESTIKLLHEALALPCAVSDWPTPENTQHMNELARFKGIALCFAAVGRIAEKDGRYYDAAAAYLDTIRLGARGLQDGVLIDRLVGNACESIGAKPLKGLAEKLAAPDCRRVITALEEIEAQREPFARTSVNEKEFVRQSSPTISQRLALLVLFPSQRQALEKAAVRTDAIILLERQTSLQVAARAYELETGKSPRDIQVLVPTYLKAPLQDPTTKTNLSL